MDAVTRLAGWLVEELPAWLPTWLPSRRWFAGKGRTLDRVEVAHVIPLTTTPPGVIALAKVTFADGAPPECYQIPVGARATLPLDLAPAVIGKAADLVVYDALADPELVAAMLRPAGVVGAAEAPPTRLVGSEQSNTSVVVGERHVLKVFRRIEPGTNPEAELQAALARAGSRHVAPFVRSIEARLDGAPVTLATVHGYLPDATDGWTTAQASLHNLPTDDFAAEAYRLGVALAAVHADLARELGTSRWGAAELRELSGALLAKLDAALAVVPGLAPHEPALRAAFASVAGLPAGLVVQRVHGDLHLGQVLGSAGGWVIIDFEGEPAAPLAERRLPQSPLRDVAGMLRSLDYAADHWLRDRASASDDRAGAARLERLERVAREWAGRSQRAFRAGYASGGSEDPGARRELLRVFQLEKAVYEAVYEVRFRPGWVGIPLGAVGRLVRDGSAGWRGRVR